MLRHSKTIVFLFFFSLAAFATTYRWAAPFFNGTSDALEMSFSNDGINWTVISSTVNGGNSPVRDGSMVKLNGVWWLAASGYTNAAPHVTFFNVRGPTTDVLNWWETPITVSCVGDIPNLDIVWAPEWFVDDDASVHIFVALGDNPNELSFVIGEKHPTNAAMTSWSAAQIITINGYTQGAPIDPFVIKKAGTYYLFFKSNRYDDLGNPSSMKILLASASTLLGPYTLIRSGDWAGWGFAEGASLQQMSDGSWWAWMDKTGFGFSPGDMYYSISTDDWATWTTPVICASNVTQIKHGTVSLFQNTPGAVAASGQRGAAVRRGVTVAR